MNELTNYLRASFNKSALFDTGIVVDYLMGDPKAKAFFEEYVFPGKLNPVISAQTACELFMAARGKREESELDQWVSKLFDVAPVSYPVAKTGGLMKRSNGVRAGDCMVAATAASLGIPLITTDPELYRKSGLRIFKPYG